MAEIFNQSNVDCNLSFLGNQTLCCGADKTPKQRKWHQKLFKWSKKTTKSTYLDLNELQDSDYPFTSNMLAEEDELTASEWSLNSQSTIASTDSTLHEGHQHSKLKRFKVKIAPQ